MPFKDADARREYDRIRYQLKKDKLKQKDRDRKLKKNIVMTTAQPETEYTTILFRYFSLPFQFRNIIHNLQQFIFDTFFYREKNAIQKGIS